MRSCEWLVGTAVEMCHGNSWRQLYHCEGLIRLGEVTSTDGFPLDSNENLPEQYLGQ